MTKILTATSGNFGNVPEFTKQEKQVKISNAGSEFVNISESILTNSDNVFSQTALDELKIYPKFPASSDIYADEEGRIQNENGEYYTAPTSALSYKIGSTDAEGVLTLDFQETLFGFINPLNSQEIQYNINLEIAVNYPISTTNINLYYSINSGVSIAIATESTLKSFNLDLSALILEEGDTVTLSMIDFNNPLTSAEIGIDIVEKTIEITDPVNDSILKIDKNINLIWSDAHVNTFEIYTALNSEPYTLLAERTSNNFIITPDMIEASEDDILHIKVKDKDSDIFDSVDVELKNAFVEITTPLNLSSIQLDTVFNVSGNSNAQRVDIYATSATATNILLAANVEIVSGEFSEMVIFSPATFEKGEPVELLVIDTADVSNFKKIYVGIYCESGGVITNFELSMTTESSSNVTVPLSMSANTEYIIGDEY